MNYNSINIGRTIGAGTFDLYQSDFQISVDTTLGICTINLPTISSILEQRLKSGYLQVIEYLIADVSGTAGVNKITVVAAGGETINGGASVDLAVNNISATLTPTSQKTWDLSSSISSGGGSVTNFQKILLVDGTYGNDTTAVPYDQLKPFQTIDAAIAVASSGDLIYINPNPSGSYFSFSNIFPFKLNYYVSKGADILFFNAGIAYVGTDDVSIFGEGTISFFNLALSGAYSGTVSINCFNITFNANLEASGSWNGDIILNATNKLTMNGFILYNNSSWWAGATKATNLTITTPEVVNNSGILFIFYPATLQLNLNIGIYNSLITAGTKDIWCFGGALPTYPVISYINIERSKADRSIAGYAGSFLAFISGNSFNTTFITGDYTYLGNGVAVQIPTLIESTYNGGKIYFNGVANITKGSMLIEVNSPLQVTLIYIVTVGVQFTALETVTNGLGASGTVLSVNSPTSITLTQTTVDNFGIGDTITGATSLTQATVNTATYDSDCKIQIKGKVNIDNSSIDFFEYLFSCYFVSECKLEILADTIYNSPLNYGLFIGRYNGDSVPTAQVDVNDSQLVNIYGSGIEPSAIIKGIDAFTPFAPTVVFWGKLRLKNNKIVTTGATSIEGGNAGEPVEVYSSYANKPQVSIANTIAGTAIITDIAITSNNF